MELLAFGLVVSVHPEPSQCWTPAEKTCQEIVRSWREGSRPSSSTPFVAPGRKGCG